MKHAPLRLLSKTERNFSLCLKNPKFKIDKKIYLYFS